MTGVLQIDAKWRTFHWQADQEEQMLTKMFVYASAWFLLSVIAGLLAGRTIYTFREGRPPGFDPCLETDWEAGTSNKVDEKNSRGEHIWQGMWAWHHHLLAVAISLAGALRSGSGLLK